MRAGRALRRGGRLGGLDASSLCPRQAISTILGCYFERGAGLGVLKLKVNMYMWWLAGEVPLLLRELSLHIVCVCACTQFFLQARWVCVCSCSVCVIDLCSPLFFPFLPPAPITRVIGRASNSLLT